MATMSTHWLHVHDDLQPPALIYRLRIPYFGGHLQEGHCAGLPQDKGGFALNEIRRQTVRELKRSILLNVGTQEEERST